MVKTTKRKTNNPNHDYVPPHGFGGITCSELSDALDTIFRQKRAPVDTAMSTIKHLSSLSCPNCGAPVRGIECEYCGTVFSLSNDVDVIVDGESVGSAVRRYSDSVERTVRHFNPETGRWEWVAENPAKGVSTPALPTKITR